MSVTRAMYFVYAQMAAEGNALMALMTLMLCDIDMKCSH
jgi:hypothetical protein